MENKIKNLEDLEVWKKSVALGIKIYKLSESGKLKNDFGAKDQIRRAACSISNNIAEGFEYNSIEALCDFKSILKDRQEK